MKVLVTGAGGFTARHLIERLRQDPASEIYCASLSFKDEPNWFGGDLTEKSTAHSLVKIIKPDYIYHLAGSFTNDYDADYLSNVVTTRNLLEAILIARRNCRILLVGSSAEYGLVKAEDNPVREDHPPNPVSVYGLTKLYQTNLMRFYHTVHGLDVLMARPFNLFGRDISRQLFIGRVYQQIEEYKKGKITRIVLGSLQSKRDYIDIDEAVKHYETIMKRGQAGEVYNVGSGRSISLYNLLKQILEENGLGMDIVEERSLDRHDKLDVKDLFADLSKTRSLSMD
jgi:GDP-4-dehydro-6-deoxy-D-mannose reductase